MIRVGNLNKSIEFYTQVLDLSLHRKKAYPEGKFTLAFLGTSDLNSEPFLELTFNWDKDFYELGTAYGHMAFGCKDIFKTCEKIKRLGGKVIREPGPMKNSTTVLAFIQDPDGYKIELIQRA